MATTDRIEKKVLLRAPLERRAKAFAANEGGWEHQARLVEKYLAPYSQ
jgi:hypothetical protein